MKKTFCDICNCIITNETNFFRFSFYNNKSDDWRLKFGKFIFRNSIEDLDLKCGENLSYLLLEIEEVIDNLEETKIQALKNKKEFNLNEIKA